MVPAKTLPARTGYIRFPLHAVFCLTFLLSFFVLVLDRNSDQHNSDPLYQVHNGGSIWWR